MFYVLLFYLTLSPLLQLFLWHVLLTSWPGHARKRDPENKNEVCMCVFLDKIRVKLVEGVG